MEYLAWGGWIILGTVSVLWVTLSVTSRASHPATPRPEGRPRFELIESGHARMAAARVLLLMDAGRPLEVGDVAALAGYALRTADDLPETGIDWSEAERGFDGLDGFRDEDGTAGTPARPEPRPSGPREAASHAERGARASRMFGTEPDFAGEGGLA